MKKLFALLLTVLMVISMAACAANEPATTTESKATTPAATKPAGTTAAATTTEAPKDLSALPFVEPGSVKITIGIKDNTAVLDYHDNAYTKYLEENTGLDLDFVFFSSDKAEAQQQLNLMVAGKEKLPDIIFGIVDETMANELGADGLLLDLKPYFENYSYWFMLHEQYYTDIERGQIWGQITNPITEEIYFFPAITISTSVDQCAYQGGLSKVMAKNVGMDASEIDTVEEVYQFLKKAVKEDGNKNGKNDEIGLVYRQDGYRSNAEMWIINAYVYCSDQYLWNVTDGELWSPYSTDEYREAMIEMNKWYAEDLISHLSYSLTSDAEAKALIETYNNFTVCAWGGHPTLITTGYKADDPNTHIGKEYTFLNVLEAETGLGGYAALRNSFNVLKNTVISADCENPELAFRLCDFMCIEEGNHWSRYGSLWEHKDGEALGEKDNQGDWAGYKVIRDEWSVETKETWHETPIYMSLSDNDPEKHGGTTFKGYDEGNRGNISYGNKWEMDAEEKPAEVVLDLIYNAEEQEVIDELENLYKEFMLESRVQFITGVLDPNDDAVWEKYLQELEVNGESDLLDAAQSAYTRMVG